ncbi:MAG: amidohydrolase [Calditrichota bacterium]
MSSYRTPKPALNASSPRILVVGRIFGGSGWNPPHWAEAMVIQSGRIRAVGPLAELDAYPGINHRIDYKDALILPGLGDAHLHLAAGGRALGMVDLGGKRGEAIVRLLSERGRQSAADNAGWVEAFNWDSALADLDAQKLDSICADLPVLIHKRDLHGCCCNNLALRRAGITAATLDPESGRLGRDPQGLPNGLLFESAVGLVRDLVPEPSLENQRRFILRAQEYLMGLGLTAVSEVLETATEDIYRRLDESSEIKLFVDGWRRYENWDQESPPDTAGHNFRVNTLKLFLDGAFGSETAALEHPYLSNSANKGMLFWRDQELHEALLKGAAKGWNLALHALGDRAVRQAFRVVEPIAEQFPQTRFRFEHLQLIPENLFISEYFRERRLQSAVTTKVVTPGWNLIASVQPVHLLDDQAWLPDRIGVERCSRAFIWKSWLDHGIPLAFGSDWPVASPDPRLNLHVAINRQNYAGTIHPAFASDENLAPSWAIRATSWGWAVAAGLTTVRGSITPGQRAAFTIVENGDQDLRDWSQIRLKSQIWDRDE